MTLDSTLDAVQVLGIETSPFIYFVEQHPQYAARMRAIFQRVHDGALQVITSAITLTEVLVMPVETAHVNFQREYREMLLNTEAITTLPVSIAIAERAAQLRVEYRLKTPDALHIATALVSGCDSFLTNDRVFKRVKELNILVLDEL